MSESDSAYLARVSDRIIRMFEMYIKNIKPDDERFNSFISNYVAQKGIKNPQALPYSDLYRIVKDGIREYIKQNQAEKK